jgi:wyosine [tRNA(Phe)-imidazoG37] synthetase (radical SAM superfamily)
METKWTIPCADGIHSPLANTAFGCPRDFLDNRFVYVVLSARARGLAVGINMNPDRRCNFDCVYCEVNRTARPKELELDVPVMATELEKTLWLLRSGGIKERAPYRELSSSLLQLRHVAFSGDGEPTLCPNFAEALQAVVHVRARNPHAFFKLVLITNGTGLDIASVQESLKYLVSNDEVWIKLDAGSQEYMDKVNRSEVSIERVVKNALWLGRQRPVIIQSLFPLVAGQEPGAEEIDQYINRLKELKEAGANISLVQIYSAARPTPNSECGHMPLKSLSRISHRIKAESGLRAEVF